MKYSAKLRRGNGGVSGAAKSRLGRGIYWENDGTHALDSTQKPQRVVALACPRGDQRRQRAREAILAAFAERPMQLIDATAIDQDAVEIEQDTKP